MSKLVKSLFTVFAFAALLFSTVGPATASANRAVANSSSVKFLAKEQKVTKNDKAKDKKKKKKKKSTSKNKNKADSKIKTGKANKKKVANFAPTAEPSPTELPACDPETDPTCDPTPIIDPTVGPEPEPTCDPTIDKLCRPDLIDPTCDPDVDPWCQIIVDPEPTEPPTGGPDPYPTPEFTWPS
ncbi:MAG: hypothetical protein KGQ38_06590, partial [Actinomycetales bacterium]|nr:hypothetical protein [Actinomycetales bacterium]